MTNTVNVTFTGQDKITSTLKKIEQSANKVQTQLENFNKNNAIDKAGSQATRLNTTLSKSPGLLSSIGSAASKAIGIFLGFRVVNGIFNTLSSSISTALSRSDTLEIFSKKMRLLTNSSETADNVLTNLKDATKGTAYMLDTAASAVQNFVTRGMSVEDAQSSVKIWMDAISAYGDGTNESFTRAIQALGRMRSKSTVEMRQINQLINTGINPVRMYAEAVGKTQEEVQNLLSSKQLKSDEFLAVVEESFRKGGGMFPAIEGWAKEAAGTWKATFNNMRMAIARGWLDMIDPLNNLFGENWLKGAFKGFGNGVESVFGSIGTVINKTGKVLKNFNLEFEKRHSLDIEINEGRISNTFDAIRYNLVDIADTFKTVFNSEWSFSIFENIRMKFMSLKETWATVLKTFTEGLKTISEPFAKFLVKYLGLSIESVEDLGKAFGEWLNLKLPGFFDKLKDILNWLVDHAETVKSSAGSVLKALISFKLLQGISGSITNFSKSVNKLKESFSGFQLVADKFTQAKGKLFGNKQGSSVAEDLVETTVKEKVVESAVSTSTVADVASKAVKPKEAKTYNNAYNYLHNYNKPGHYSELSKESKTTEKPFLQKYIESYNQPGYYGSNKNTVSSKNLKSDNRGLNYNGSFIDKKSQSNVTKSLFETKDVYTSNNGIYDYLHNYNKPGYYGYDKKTTVNSNSLKNDNRGLNHSRGIYDYLNNYNKPGYYKNIKKQKEPFSLSKFFTKSKTKAVEIAKDPVGSTKSGFFNFVDKVKDTGKSIKNSQFVEGVGGMAKTSAGWIKDGLKDNNLTKGISKVKNSQFVEGVGGMAKTSLGWLKEGLTDNTITNGIAKIGESLSGLMQNPFFAGIQNAVSSVLSFGTSFLGAVPMITVFTGALGAVVAGLGLLNPDNAVSDGINSFFDNFGEKCNNFTDNAVSMITGFGEKIRESFPKLIEQGVNLVLSLVNGLFVGLPNLIGAAGSIIMNFVGELFATLPTIVQGGFEAICQFIEGLLSPESISNIFGAVVNMISTLLKAIITNIPKIISGGIQLVIGIITGIGKMIVSLGKSIINLIVTGWNYFWEHKGEIWENIKNFGANIVTWIKDGIKGAWDGFCNWFSNLFNWGGDPENITDNSGQDLGEQIDNNVEDGIDSGAGDVVNSTTDMVDGAVNGAQEELDDSYLDASGLGESYSESYASGLESSAGQISEAFAMIAQTGGDSLGNYEATQEIGRNYIASFVQGITDKQEDAFLKAQEIAHNMLTVMEGSLLSFNETLPEDIANKFLELITQVIGYIDTMCVGIEERIGETQTLTEGTMLALRQVIEGDFRLAMQNAISEFEKNAADLEKKVETLYQTITATVDPLPNNFNELGKSMMIEFNYGIQSEQQKVINTVSALVQKLKDVFTDGLGIHSPSRVMYAYGGYTAEGFINGLSDADIAKFTANTVEEMKASFANGKFNPYELVNFLSDDETIALVGYLSNLDTSTVGVDSIAYPLVGTMGTISSYFGHRASPGGIGSTNHGGIDIAAPTGTPIASSLAGTIVQAGWNGGYGKSVTVDHGNGTKTLYGHMSEVLSQVGQAVTKGQTIGLVGSTGNSTGPHVHYEVHLNGQRTDPLPYLQGAGLMGGDPLVIAIMNALNAKNGVSVASAFGASSFVSGAYNLSANVTRWSAVAMQALAMLGQSNSYLNDVLWMIQGESGGNPFDVNNWDSNAKRGDPSRGLVQTIGATFRAYRNPSLSANIFDPLSNIYAGLNYAIHRYGSLENLFAPRRGGWYGYAVGTRYVPSDMLAMIHEGEAIIPKSQNPYSQSGGDYLSDIIEDKLESDNGMTASLDADSMFSSDSSGNTLNGNIIFDVKIDKDADGDRFVGNLEQELHRIFNQGRKTTSAR